MKRITDPTFKYVRSEKTDLSETFKREYKRLKRIAEQEKLAEAERIEKVRNIA